MRWRVQLGIKNSTNDVWKFWQNWTKRRGESNLANFQTHEYCYTLHYEYIISIIIWQNWILLRKHHILSPKPSPARLSTKIWYFCSYFYLVLFLKQNLVLLLVFSSSSSREISFRISVQNTFPPFS